MSGVQQGVKSGGLILIIDPGLWRIKQSVSLQSCSTNGRCYAKEYSVPNVLNTQQKYCFYTVIDSTILLEYKKNKEKGRHFFFGELWWVLTE